MTGKYFSIFQKRDLMFTLLLFILSFAFYTHYIAYNVGGDAVSQYYPSQRLLEKGDLNFWNPLNNRYDTYYFKLPFTDEVIYSWNKSYPMQTLGTILLDSFIMSIFGNNAFFYINPLFASLCVVFVYLTITELIKNKVVATLSSLVLFSMPVFVFWAVVPQNIMPSTFFLTISLYCIVKYNNSNRKLYIIFSSIFFACCVFTRLPHILFAPAYIIYFFGARKELRFNVIEFMYFLIPFGIIFLLITLLKVKYFGDPFFIGYLQTNYHPMTNGEDLVVSTKDTYLLTNVSIVPILNSIKIFISGSIRIFCPLFPVSFLGLMSKNKKLSPFKIYFIIILSISLFYYGHLEPTLWKPENEIYAYSLSLVFFRYMLPVYVLSTIMLAVVLDFILKKEIVSKNIMSIIFVLTILLISYFNTSVYYVGGASLLWYEDINSQIIDYSTELPNYIENNSVILYATRNPLSYTYPFTMNYNWFYYDGVPPAYREVHTKEIVHKLLADNQTVYFVGFEAPYDELSIDMYHVLNDEFDLKYVPGTHFQRMKSRFYLVKESSHNEKKFNEMSGTL